MVSCHSNLLFVHCLIQCTGVQLNAGLLSKYDIIVVLYLTLHGFMLLHKCMILYIMHNDRQIVIVHKSH